MGLRDGGCRGQAGPCFLQTRPALPSQLHQRHDQSAHTWESPQLSRVTSPSQCPPEVGTINHLGGSDLLKTTQAGSEDTVTMTM